MALPQHHFGVETLLDFAAGTAMPGPGLAVACHLDFCRACRTTVQEIEILTEAIVLANGLANGLANPLSNGLGRARDRLLREAAWSPTPLPLPARSDARLQALGLPQVLRRSLPPDATRPLFRRLLPGIETADLVLETPATKARLMRFGPGVTVPEHDHEGTECAVVLQGHFREHQTRFGPGDVCLGKAGAPHQLRVDPAAECITLIVTQGRIIPRSLLGKAVAFICRM